MVGLNLLPLAVGAYIESWSVIWKLFTSFTYLPLVGIFVAAASLARNVDKSN